MDNQENQKPIIFERKKFQYDDIREMHTLYIEDYPIVYILHQNKTSKARPKAYIGQTVHVHNRMRDHLKNSQRKDLTDALFIGHQAFNQSATFNIETNLINYFIADNQFSLQNVSQTANLSMHNYYQKTLYDDELFEDLWESLRREGLAKETTDNLKNRDIYKLSPFKTLSEPQRALKENILHYCKKVIQDIKNQKSIQKKVYVIHGEAGTGKSVILSSLFNTLQEEARQNHSALAGTRNYLLVNHTEMLKTYRQISESLPYLKKKDFNKPTPFINSQSIDEADIVLIDEGHLLLTQPDAYNNFYGDNQLDAIMEKAKVAVLIFDEKQYLKVKSKWDRDDLKTILSQYDVDEFKLTDQFRMNASPEVLNWVDNFVEKKISPLPPSDERFEFKIFDDSEAFKDYIYQKNAEKGLSRIVSTFDYAHKKNGDVYLVDQAGVNLPWNTTNSKVTWSERPETINEVGSIYTVQGFDLNYVGIVLGPSVDYDFEAGKLVIDPSKYQDTGGYSGANRFSTYQEAMMAKEQIILNSINVLMKRGIYGLALYAVNDNLKRKLYEIKEEAGKYDV
ncbi:DUF2075 domain-containing protein [Aerococcus urinaeequi]|uniref:Endonuclease n=1 Tax=Aerococcus urinaeequi TaxID=51665 RepID=A0AAC8X1E1_9LACT|nr:DUF2075 domain-containing protein [Aerococcus urinaeequi]AMB98092.1 endonuclease [Aerococcus urinaeequi]